MWKSNVRITQKKKEKEKNEPITEFIHFKVISFCSIALYWILSPRETFQPLLLLLLPPLKDYWVTLDEVLAELFNCIH